MSRGRESRHAELKGMSYLPPRHLPIYNSIAEEMEKVAPLPLKGQQVSEQQHKERKAGSKMGRAGGEKSKCLPSSLFQEHGRDPFSDPIITKPQKIAMF